MRKNRERAVMRDEPGKTSSHKDEGRRSEQKPEFLRLTLLTSGLIVPWIEGLSQVLRGG